MSFERKDHADHTATKAIGETNKEWRSMAKLAVTLRKQNVHPVWAEKKEQLFTGIYKRLLTDPIEEVERESKRR